MDWTCRSDTEKKKSIIHRIFMEETFSFAVSDLLTGLFYFNVVCFPRH
jgi:hypothetical protein